MHGMRNARFLVLPSLDLTYVAYTPGLPKTGKSRKGVVEVPIERTQLNRAGQSSSPAHTYPRPIYAVYRLAYSPPGGFPAPV